MRCPDEIRLVSANKCSLDGRRLEDLENVDPLSIGCSTKLRHSASQPLFAGHRHETLNFALRNETSNKS